MQNTSNLHARVENDLRNHPPTGRVMGLPTGDIMDGATERFVDLAHWLIEHVPEGRELSTALTKLEECSMHTKAGMARHQS